MHQNGGAFIGTVLEKREDARIIEIFFADVIADLNAEVTRSPAATQFLASGVDVLQRDLAQRPQSAFPLITHLERNVIE